MPVFKTPFRQFLFNSAILSLAVFGTWLWTNSFFQTYNLQLAAVIVGFCFLFRFFRQSSLLLDTGVFTVGLLLILGATGGLNSSFFFLVYFLLFAVALLFAPPTTLSLTLALTLYFAKTLTSVHTALQLFSLLLFTPLAIYFGKQFKKDSQLNKTIAKEETDTLLWLSLNFKNSLLKIIHETSEILADNRLPLGKTGRENLQSVHKTAKELLKSGEKLQEKVDNETD